MDEPQLADLAEPPMPDPLGWCIVELMGHRRLGGFVTEQEIAGRGFLRVGVPGDGDEDLGVQFYSSTAVYAITPTTEATARAVARLSRPAPVQRWELPLPDDDDLLTEEEMGSEDPF